MQQQTDTKTQARLEQVSVQTIRNHKRNGRVITDADILVNHIVTTSQGLLARIDVSGSSTEIFDLARSVSELCKVFDKLNSITVVAPSWSPPT